MNDLSANGHPQRADPITFLTYPLRLLLAPLLRKLGEKLLDAATGERSSWPMGDTLLDCPIEPDDSEPTLSWLHPGRRPTGTPVEQPCTVAGEGREPPGHQPRSD